MIQFQENTWTDGKTKQKEGQTLCYITLPTTARGPKRIKFFLRNQCKGKKRKRKKDGFYKVLSH